MSNMDIRYSAIEDDLKQHGQSQLLDFYTDLSDEEKVSLLNQIQKFDFHLINIENKNVVSEIQEKQEPIPTLTINERTATKSEYEKIGTEAIRNHKIGAVILAGGQGTRLGINQPKGMLNIGLSRPLYLFQILISNTLRVVKAANSWIPIFIMTNPDSLTEIVSFFEEHHYFDYDKDYVFFFNQDMVPSVDFNGKILLEDKGRLSVSPNGNGGWFSSLVKAGLLNTLKEYGIEWLNVVSVDNALQNIADCCFIGATIKSGCNCGAKVVRKADPDEKVGVPCYKNGKPSIIEYYELPENIKNVKNEKQEFLFNYGVILNYLFKVEKLEQIDTNKMPTHMVKKIIPHIDNNGSYILPEAPNGYKFETLLTDMVYFMESCLPYEVERSKEFAPIKNKTGVDSLESARKLLNANHMLD